MVSHKENIFRESIQCNFFKSSDSSFSMKLLEETVKTASDDIDNYSLSSFLMQLDQHVSDDQGM